MSLTSTPSARVVTAVAEAAETDPLDLPPLYSALDPDALDALVTNSESSSIFLTFPYAGYTVSIHGDGEVDVEEAPTRTTSTEDQGQQAED